MPFILSLIQFFLAYFSLTSLSIILDHVILKSSSIALNVVALILATMLIKKRMPQHRRYALIVVLVGGLCNSITLWVISRVFSHVDNPTPIEYLLAYCFNAAVTGLTLYFYTSDTSQYKRN